MLLNDKYNSSGSSWARLPLDRQPHWPIRAKRRSARQPISSAEELLRGRTELRWLVSVSWSGRLAVLRQSRRETERIQTRRCLQ
ncbi:hypothetical protein MHYP_G00075060 [Metynnis hypsauchen]